MNRRVRLSAAAETDVALAAGWYNTQVPGLGNSFIAKLEAVCHRIAEYPEIHQVAFDDVRRAVVQRYPYVVIYRARPTAIDVLGILPSRADPQLMVQRASVPSSRQ